MTPPRPKIVAVDGPAGSGKSTICARVSERLGWSYVNTGALYRAVGFFALERQIDLDDAGALAALVDGLAPGLRWDPALSALWFEDRLLTDMLASEEAGYAASKVAKLPLVRERLLPIQRQITLAARRGVLVDGRDIGTVVFPDADLKVFLTASLEERSRRRLNQLGAPSQDPALLDDVKRGLARRDQRDEHREVAPLKQAQGSIVLDTSALSLDETVEALIHELKAHGLVD